MKAAIVYYSYSGNTRKVSEILKDYLGLKNYQVEMIPLEPLDESANFFMQCKRAFGKVRARLKNPRFDMAAYDLVCIGSPVWAFAPVPAVNTFLDRCSGLVGKESVVFTTYGSGTGNNKCLQTMVKALEPKGVNKVKLFTIQQFKVKDSNFVNNELEKSGI